MADAEAQQNEEAFLTAVYRGSDLLGKGDLPGAQNSLREALDLRPDDPKAQNLMGLVCFKLGEYDEAERLYQLLVHDNPADATLRVNLGLVYLKSGRFEEAIKELSVAIDLDVGHKRAQNYLGLALARVGDYARARDHFEAAGSAQMVEQMDRALAGDDVDGGKKNGAAKKKAGDAFGAEVDTTTGDDDDEEVVLEMEIYDDDVVAVVDEDEPELDYAHDTPPDEESEAAEEEYAADEQDYEEDAYEDESYDAPAGLPPPPIAPQWQGTTPLVAAAEFVEVGPQEHRPFSIGREVVVLGVRTELLVRLTRMVAAEGNLTLTPEVKRFRGRATDKPFGEGAQRIHRVTGEGRLLLGRGTKFFIAVTIDGVDGYFLEQSVCAFEETVSYENGRVPSSVSDDLNLVHLRGRGSVLLEAPAALISTAIDKDRPLRVPPRHLVGWHGTITPRIVSLSEDGGDGTPVVAVELTGDGVALVSLPSE